MKKNKYKYPKMKNGINKTYQQYFNHAKIVGKLNNTWGCCDKTSSIGSFGGGGGS